MGLDMYLTYLNGSEAIYWRKANAIHGWFVRNVQNNKDDCKPYPVTRAQLIQLRDICIKVWARQKPELAATILPPMEGFFFGETKIDEQYYDDVKTTLDRLSNILNTNHMEFIYQSSW